MIPNNSLSSGIGAPRLVVQHPQPNQQPVFQGAPQEDRFQPTHHALDALQEDVAPPADANTRLHTNAAAGNTPAVIEALNGGAEINHTTAEGDTALIEASRNNRPVTVQTLLDRGADTTIRNQRGGTALDSALRHHNAAVVNVFFRNGAKNGNTELVSTLLGQGANIDEADANGDTALILAARNGHAGTVKELLNRGANTTLTNNRGGRAVQSAERHHHQAVLNVFYHQAAKTGDSVILNWLLNRNAVELNHADEDGDTALIHAARNGQAEIVRNLLERGADGTIRNIRGGTALDSAIRHGRQDVIAVFLAHAALQEQPGQPVENPLPEGMPQLEQQEGPHEPEPGVHDEAEPGVELEEDPIEPGGNLDFQLQPEGR
jgi:ankyrin repeat protein